jgi:hypothetical protein
MLGEEFLDASIEVQFVFWPVEAATFVGIHDVGGFDLMSTAKKNGSQARHGCSSQRFKLFER